MCLQVSSKIGSFFLMEVFLDFLSYLFKFLKLILHFIDVFMDFLGFFSMFVQGDESGELIGNRRDVLNKFTEQFIASSRRLHPFGEA